MPQRAQKSVLLAYGLWLFLGLFGAHRFYLGKWFTGLVYLISFGLYGMGWLLDFVLLWWMVWRYNSRVAEEEEEEEELPELPPLYRKTADDLEGYPRLQRAPARSEVEYEELPPRLEEPPAWVRERSFRPVEFLLRVGFFLVAPAIFVICVLMLEQWELLVLALATMVVGAFIGDVETTLRNFPVLEKVPLLGNALDHLHHFTRYYRRTRPFHFIYYLLYPVTFPLTAPFSRAARQEFIVFGRLIGGLLLLVLARIGFGYYETFPPHLGPKEAFVFAFALTVFLLGLTTLFLIPTVTTALTLNASQRTGQLRFLVFLGLVSGLPMGFAFYNVYTSKASFLDYQLLRDRMKTASFREELRQEGTMFLGYWQHHGAELREPMNDTPGLHKELTERWQRHMGGMVPRRETNAFHIVAWKQREGTPGLGLVLTDRNTDQPGRLLLVQAPSGQFHSDWNQVPQEVKQALDQARQGGVGKLEAGTLLDNPAKDE